MFDWNYMFPSGSKNGTNAVESSEEEGDSEAEDEEDDDGSGGDIFKC